MICRGHCGCRERNGYLCPQGTNPSLEHSHTLFADSVFVTHNFDTAITERLDYTTNDIGVRNRNVRISCSGGCNQRKVLATYLPRPCVNHQSFHFVFASL